MSSQFSVADRGYIKGLLEDIKQTMYGMDDEIRLCLVALFTGGHVLLEGNPGMGKTDLVRTMANVLGLRFRRLQFTPELMPSDITGTYTRDFQNSTNPEWKFRPGPVFTSLLLADEINRATPKTQSAMLEVMAERQVTPPGDTFSYNLDETKIIKEQDRRPDLPFIVLATQNPIDNEGTYNLPEAQADRFMFKIQMPLPNTQILQEILKKRTQPTTPSSSTTASPSKPSGSNMDTPRMLQTYRELSQRILAVPPAEQLQKHIFNIIHATNGQTDLLKDHLQKMNKPDREQLEKLMKLFNFGLGPRAAINLMLGAKGWHYMWANTTSQEADIHDLLKVILPTLRHRLYLKFDWAEQYFSNVSAELGERGYTDTLREIFLHDLCLYTAPDKQYAEIVRHSLELDKHALDKLKSGKELQRR